MMKMMTVSSRFPFTSTQWQELEHQALVFKYIISGMPIPPHLLFSIKTSLESSTKLILHTQSPHHSIVWDYFHMGFGKKIDPEPGRCKRTDGKKWRCSKEAYLDSKYCERHMHRGRNRSRKPVEANLLTNSTPNKPSSICSKFPKYTSQGSHSPFVHPQFSSSRSPANVLSSQDRFLLESSPCLRSEKDRSIIISASVRDYGLLEPLAVSNSSSSLAHSNQKSLSDRQNDYLYSQLQNTPTRQKHDQEGCYDQLALKIDGKDEAHKVMHHFFDESPDNDNDYHNKDKDSSTTQLTISTPNHGHDFFLT
ncbi:hypothetical protein R6Q59_017556 [Mikania micrantha]